MGKGREGRKEGRRGAVWFLLEGGLGRSRRHHQGSWRPRKELGKPDPEAEENFT